MSELARVDEGVSFTRSDLETLRSVIAPGIPDAELSLYAKVCENLGLSPFRGEIVVVKRNVRDPKSPASAPRWFEVWRHQITIVGRRVMAERTGEVEGITGPEWCGPHAPHADSPLQWLDVWLRDEPPHAARAVVYRRGRKPYVGTTPWREFYVRDKDNKPTGLWATMPAHMLGKTAESLALGRAFPEILAVARAAGVEYEDAPRDEGHDVAAAEVGPSPTPGEVPSPPRPRNPHEYLARDLIRPDQVKRIQGLFEALDLSGEGHEATRHALIVNAIGHEYESAAELTPSEGGAIIAALEILRAEVEARVMEAERESDERDR